MASRLPPAVEKDALQISSPVRRDHIRLDSTSTASGAVRGVPRIWEGGAEGAPGLTGSLLEHPRTASSANATGRWRGARRRAPCDRYTRALMVCEPERTPAPTPRP